MGLERTGKETLDNLAAATGWLAFFPEPDDIRDVLSGIHDALSGQYILGYYPADNVPGWRNIQVSLPRPRAAPLPLSATLPDEVTARRNKSCPTRANTIRPTKPTP